MCVYRYVYLQYRLVVANFPPPRMPFQPPHPPPRAPHERRVQRVLAVLRHLELRLGAHVPALTRVGVRTRPALDGYSRVRNACSMGTQCILWSTLAYSGVLCSTLLRGYARTITRKRNHTRTCTHTHTPHTHTHTETLGCACAPPRARPSWRRVLACVDAFACACVPPAWEIAAVAGGPRSSRATRHGSRSERREKPCRPRTAPSRGRSTPAGAASRPTPATSAPGLGSPPPHLRRDWAHPCHICAGLTPATSAPGLGPTRATSVSLGMGPIPRYICTGTGAHPPPHLHRDWGPSPATSVSLGTSSAKG
jgi:hypothetical protein